jgi:hypothetical protein
MAERIYRFLLLLFPADHRQAYGEPMLLHARDLGRDARRQGGWQIPWLYLRLVKDGVLNAWYERWEAIMGKNQYVPASWLTVLLAAIPGLFLVFERVDIMQLGQILPRLITFGYLAIVVIGVPLVWYRQRRFPVWALLPAGLLLWMAAFMVGDFLAWILGDLGWISPLWQDALFGLALLAIGLTVVFFALGLRGVRLTTPVWLVSGVIVSVNLLETILYFSSLPASARYDPALHQFLYNAAIGLLDGLMLVAVGTLAVRQHGVLAILVVIGGYGYMCMDSDFISGFRLNEWAGYTAYMISMVALYLVVTPIALLRARTPLGRLLAVFIPVGIFHIARIAVPALVRPGPEITPWGDILLSVNVMLNFALAWVLYTNIDQVTHREAVVGVMSLPPQPSMSGNQN